MTQSFTRPGIVTSRSSEREDDKFLNDAKAAMNAFPTVSRSLTTAGTAAYTTIWASRAYQPNMVIRFSAEVVAITAAGSFLDWSLRGTYITDASGLLVQKGFIQSYGQDSGGSWSSLVQINVAGNGIMELQVRDGGGAVTAKWSAVVQLKERSA